MQVYVNWLLANILTVFENVDDISTKLIIDVCTVFFVTFMVLFLLSIPIFLLIEKFTGTIKGYVILSAPIIGFALMSIVFSFLHFFKIEGSDSLVVVVEIIVFNLFLLFLWFCNKGGGIKILIKKYITKEFLFVSLVIPFLVFSLIIFPMVLTGNIIYTPGYNVNHDALVYETGALRLEENLAFEPLSGGGFDKVSQIVGKDTHHTSQYYLLHTFKSLLDGEGFSDYYTFYDMDYFELTHLLQVAFYSLISIPLYLIFKSIFKVDRKYLFIPALFGALTVLTIQYLNQVSFSQNIISAPLYFVLFLLIIKLPRLIRKNLNIKEIIISHLPLVIVTLGAMGYYGYTSLTWILPALLFVSIMNIKKFLPLLKTGITLSVVTAILGFPAIYSSYKLFTLTTTSETQEIGLFGMTGNMFGYPSFTNLFNAVIALDFRVESEYLIVSILFVIFVLVILAYLLFKNKQKVDLVGIVGFVFAFGVPMAVARFYYQAPYIWGKCLFYFAPFVMLLVIYLLIKLWEMRNWFTLFALPILALIAFNVFNSLFLISPPSMTLVYSLREINETNIQGFAEGERTLYIDDFDWGKYFLARFDPILTYDRAFSDYSLSNTPYSWINPIMLSQFDENKIQTFTNLIVANEFLDSAPENYSVIYEDGSYTVFSKQ